MSAVDRNGKTVEIGSFVRLLNFNSRFLERLPEDEKIKLNSMLNDILEVYNIEEGRIISVMKTWDYGNGHTESHALGVSSDDIEFISSPRFLTQKMRIY